jgi:hypothetical protein
MAREQTSRRRARRGWDGLFAAGRARCMKQKKDNFLFRATS